MSYLHLRRLSAGALPLLAVLTGVIACCAACGSSGASPPTEPIDAAEVTAPALSNDLGIAPLVAGDQAVSAQLGGPLQMELVSTNPQQQQRGYNAFTVRFLDLSGAPYQPGAVTVIPWMPAHGHGTAVAASVHPGLNAGEWVLDNLNLFMPSYWKVYAFVCASPEGRCCDASTEPCDETSDSWVDTLFFRVWIPS
jgi:hypothetical protein